MPPYVPLHEAALRAAGGVGGRTRFFFSPADFVESRFEIAFEQSADGNRSPTEEVTGYRKYCEGGLRFEYVFDVLNNFSYV
jgi:hypothetical protein